MKERSMVLFLLVIVVIQSVVLLRATMSRQESIATQPPLSTNVVLDDKSPDLDLRLSHLEDAVRELTDEVRARAIETTEPTDFVADVQYDNKQGQDTRQEEREAELDPKYMHASDLIQSYASSIRNPEDADKIIQAIADVPNQKLQRSLLQKFNNQINRGW